VTLALTWLLPFVGFDKPLWAYDPAGKLKRKCRFLASLGQGVALTEANFQNQVSGALCVRCVLSERV
jgi:hypothetical protein